MMPKWSSFSWEMENYWKRWKTFQFFFFFFNFSLCVLVKWIQQAYHKLTNGFSWPALTFAVNKSLEQKTFITSGNNAHLFFHVTFLNTSKPLTIFAASCIQLPNTVCLPDQIFHMKVFNIHIFFTILILFQQLVLLLSKQGVGPWSSMRNILHTKCKELEGPKIFIYLRWEEALSSLGIQIIALRLILKSAEVQFLSLFLILKHYPYCIIVRLFFFPELLFQQQMHSSNDRYFKKQ